MVAEKILFVQLHDTPQHAPKIILGALLSRTLDIKIAHLILIFKLQH